MNFYRKNFFNDGGQLFLQSTHKICYPARAIIILAVRDEYIVFEAGNGRRHISKIKKQWPVNSEESLYGA